MRWLCDGTDRLNWSDLVALVTRSHPESALSRYKYTDNTWTVDSFLIANVVDALTILAWQQTEDGAKNRNRPKPIWRPGQQDEQPEDNTVERFGEAHTLDEVNDHMASFWPQAA